MKKKTAGNFLTTSAKELGWIEKKMVDVSFFMFFFSALHSFFGSVHTRKNSRKKKTKKQEKRKNF